MDYHGFYRRLIERARRRVLDGYVERHHVVPRCLGGSDKRSNIVQLTAEEHYVAHQLLVQIHPENFGLVWAAIGMTNSSGKMFRGNKRYGWLRRKFSVGLSERMKGRKASPETIAKLRAAKLGKVRSPHTQETKAKMSAASKGIAKSSAHREALSKAKIGNKNRLGGKKLGCFLEI